MRFWTAHLRAREEPVLMREGFSWGALVFGPFWLLAHRAWIPAVLALAGQILIVALAPAGLMAVLGLALAVLIAASARDLARWSMENRGYLLVHVIAARNEADALARLLTNRPDLAARFMPPEAAR